MGGTHALVMGDRGRLVIPADIRAEAKLERGTKLILVTTDDGLLLMTVDQARDLLRRQIGDRDLVAELLAERRAEAHLEDGQ